MSQALDRVQSSLGCNSFLFFFFSPLYLEESRRTPKLWLLRTQYWLDCSLPRVFLATRSMFLQCGIAPPKIGTRSLSRFRSLVFFTRHSDKQSWYKKCDEMKHVFFFRIIATQMLDGRDEGFLGGEQKSKPITKDAADVEWKYVNPKRETYFVFIPSVWYNLSWPDRGDVLCRATYGKQPNCMHFPCMAQNKSRFRGKITEIGIKYFDPT